MDRQRLASRTVPETTPEGAWLAWVEMGRGGRGERGEQTLQTDRTATSVELRENAWLARLAGKLCEWQGALPTSKDLLFTQEEVPALIAAWQGIGHSGVRG